MNHFQLVQHIKSEPEWWNWLSSQENRQCYTMAQLCQSVLQISVIPKRFYKSNGISKTGNNLAVPKDSSGLTIMVKVNYRKTNKNTS